MTISAKPFNDCNCCGYGFQAFFNDAYDRDWLMLNSTTIEIRNQSDGLVNNTLSSASSSRLIGCDDRNNFYALEVLEDLDLEFYATFKKYNPTGTVAWSYDDYETDIYRGHQGGNEGYLGHFDIGADYKLYYCGRKNTTGTGTPSNRSAIVTVLNDSGELVRTMEVFEELGETIDEYNFISCAVDANGNCCAVGGRYKNDNGQVLKSDYIVYYFDADGNEVWHDEVPDDTTNNNLYRGIWARQVCFDSDGNVYIGFGAGNFTSSPSVPAGTISPRPRLKKYAPDGTIVWTKTSTFVETYNLITDPSDNLIECYRDGGSSSPVRVRKLSGASHSTTDWTTTIHFFLTSVGDIACDEDGDVYAIHRQGYFKLLGADGSSVYQAGATFPICVACKPGRHPVFI